MIDLFIYGDRLLGTPDGFVLGETKLYLYMSQYTSDSNNIL